LANKMCVLFFFFFFFFFFWANAFVRPFSFSRSNLQSSGRQARRVGRPRKGAPPSSDWQDEEDEKNGMKKRRRSASSADKLEDVHEKTPPPASRPYQLTIDLSGPDDEVVFIESGGGEDVVPWPADPPLSPLTAEQAAEAKAAQEVLRKAWDRSFESDDTIERIRKGEEANKQKRNEMP
jgi:hypothetical protein